MKNDQKKNNLQYECLQTAFVNILLKEAQTVLITTTLFFCVITSSQGILLSKFDVQSSSSSLIPLFLASLFSFLILSVFLYFVSRLTSFITTSSSNEKAAYDKSWFKKYWNEFRPFLPVLFLFVAICLPGFGIIAFFFIPFVLRAVVTSEPGEALNRLKQSCIVLLVCSLIFFLFFVLPIPEEINYVVVKLFRVPLKSFSIRCLVVPSFVVPICILINLGLRENGEKWVRPLCCPWAFFFISANFVASVIMLFVDDKYFWRYYAVATAIPFIYMFFCLGRIYFFTKPQIYSQNVSQTLFEKICGSQKIDESHCPVGDVVRVSDGYYRIFSQRYFNSAPDRQGEGGYVACLNNDEKIFPSNSCVWNIFRNIGSGASPLFPSIASESQKYRMLFDVLARKASEWFLIKDNSSDAKDEIDKVLRRQFLLKWSSGDSVTWVKEPWESAEALGIPDRYVCSLYYPPCCGIVDQNGFHCKAVLTIEISLKETVKQAFNRVSDEGRKPDDVKLLQRLLVCYPLILPSIYSSLLNEIIKRAKEKNCLDIEHQNESFSRDQTIFEQNENLTDIIAPKYVADFVSLRVSSSPIEQAVLNSQEYADFIRLNVKARTTKPRMLNELRELEEICRKNARNLRTQVNDLIGKVIPKLRGCTEEGKTKILEALGNEYMPYLNSARTSLTEGYQRVEKATEEIKDALQDKANIIASSFFENAEDRRDFAKGDQKKALNPTKYRD